MTGPGLLADAVVPVSYAVKGSAFAVSLWYDKSRRPPDYPSHPITCLHRQAMGTSLEGQ